ncbi:MAG: hypothetical protein MI919_11485 [Holophagales bacterium]|nr:hypothetical protein [Holophagales bacterium]
MPSEKRKSHIVLSAIVLLFALSATPALADCFQDAKALYDSCVNFQFVLNGQLTTISEEACAEVSAEATNGCLRAAGKLDPQYSLCRNRYDFYIPESSDCPSGWYYTESAFVDLEVRHYCSGYLLIRRTITCS